MASGKEFTDRLFGLRKRSPTGRHAFDQLCTDLAIEHRLLPSMHPQTNGMVERCNGRIAEVLQSHHFRSGEELETTLHRYVALYNQQLPQSALGSKTPLQAMRDWHGLKPDLFRKQPHYLTGFYKRRVPAERQIIRRMGAGKGLPARFRSGRPLRPQQRVSWSGSQDCSRTPPERSPEEEILTAKDFGESIGISERAARRHFAAGTYKGEILPVVQVPAHIGDKVDQTSPPATTNRKPATPCVAAIWQRCRTTPPAR